VNLAFDWSIAVRILAAVIMGGTVAWIHRRTSQPASDGTSLPTTFVLLAGLIAMVTQVIGDNVARAFSLVGALSIVRFRTVVRDTRDTAFVIFAVVAGMAAGAEAYWLAGAGIVIVGGAAFALAARRTVPVETGNAHELRLRASIGVDVESAIGDILRECLLGREVLAVATVKQGGAIDYIYAVTPRPGKAPEELVRRLNKLEGIQEVRWQQRGQDGE